MLENLKHYFCSKVISTAGRLQSIESNGNQSVQADPVSNAIKGVKWTINEAGEEILKCLEGLSKATVKLLLLGQ